MGPGTHVITKILNGVLPKSETDLIAMYHDIDYLTNEEPIFSDMRAIGKTEFNLQGIAMRAGLGMRSVADAFLHLTPFKNIAHLNGRTDNVSVSTEELVDVLRQKADLLAEQFRSQQQ